MFVCLECGAPQASAGHCPADGTLLAPIGEDVLLGTTIGAYRVARLLGVGGMGRVYKGVHPSIGSRVAIKVLSRECTDRRDLVERFFAEAKAVNLIRHESIVNVLDLATLPDGRPYIIMEYLDGAPLASIVDRAVEDRQPLPLGGLARLAVEVLDALAAAHAKGIVHRDLKPDNIFVTPSGRPKVLDFGIAKLEANAGSATRTGSLLGTPHYMSPEQAAGKVVDHRADLYAMGVILFECATGQKPFLAESLFDLLRKHVEVPPPPPRALRPDLSPELEAVILTALAKPPDQRFASAQAMSMAIQQATSGLATEHWTPITGAGGHRVVSSAGWQPTPPATWGGRGSQSPTPPTQRELPPRVAGSGPAQAPPTPVGRPRRRAWLGGLALVVVGGGIAAAVIATRGGGEEAGGGAGVPAVADRSPDSPSEVVAPTHPAAPATHPAAPATQPGPAAPSARPPAATDRDSDEGDDGDGDEIDPVQQLDQALAQLDALDPKLLPAETRKLVEEVRGLGKLSAAERLARLRALQQLPAVANAVAAEPAAPAAARGDGWVESHELEPPRGFDPKRVDVSAFIRYAVAQARQAVPDARLFRIDVDGVSSDGFANLELPSLASPHGTLALRFFSPARSQRDPKVPRGVPVQWNCELRIEATPEGVQIRPVPGFDCSRNVPIPVPACTAAGVWKRALAKRAPADAIAQLGFRSGGGNKPTWYFDIGHGFDRELSEVFDDGC